ncbi:MAG: hypothetical protein V1735_05055 [Nanoarchaeota archaeon]
MELVKKRWIASIILLALALIPAAEAPPAGYGCCANWNQDPLGVDLCIDDSYVARDLCCPETPYHPGSLPSDQDNCRSNYYYETLSCDITPPVEGEDPTTGKCLNGCCCSATNPQERSWGLCDFITGNPSLWYGPEEFGGFGGSCEDFCADCAGVECPEPETACMLSRCVAGGGCEDYPYPDYTEDMVVDPVTGEGTCDGPEDNCGGGDCFCVGGACVSQCLGLNYSECRANEYCSYCDNHCVDSCEDCVVGGAPWTCDENLDRLCELCSEGCDPPCPPDSSCDPPSGTCICDDGFLSAPPGTDDCNDNIVDGDEVCIDEDDCSEPEPNDCTTAGGVCCEQGCEGSPLTSYDCPAGEGICCQQCAFFCCDPAECTQPYSGGPNDCESYSPPKVACAVPCSTPTIPTCPSGLVTFQCLCGGIEAPLGQYCCGGLIQGDPCPVQPTGEIQVIISSSLEHDTLHGASAIANDTTSHDIFGSSTDAEGEQVVFIIPVPYGTYNVKGCSPGHTCNRSIDNPVTVSEGVVPQARVIVDPVGCGIFDPQKPSSFSAGHIKGEPQADLTWTMPEGCTIIGFILTRYDTSLGPESAISILLPPESLRVIDPILPAPDWEKTYNYSIRAVYAIGRESEAVSLLFFTGNLMCAGILTDDEMCLNRDLVHDDENVQNNVLRYLCNDENLLDTAHPSESQYDCSVMLPPDGFCVGPDESGITQCKRLAECEDETGGLPFGLYYRFDTCTMNEQFCYYDVQSPSFSSVYIVDVCSDCNLIGGHCSEYKSEAACDADSCGYGVEGACTWYPGIYDELGKGYCVQENDDSTLLCSDCQNPGLFMECTEDMCEQLGDCFEGSDGCAACDEGTGCWSYGSDDSSCGLPLTLDYVSPTCHFPVSATPGTDACGIGVCSFNEGHCIHDANLDDAHDCDPAIDELCNKDGIPPTTTITPLPTIINAAGWTGTVTVTDELVQAGTFYFCLGDEDCCPGEHSKAYDSSSTEFPLRFEDEGETDIDLAAFRGHAGFYHLRYLSQDYFKNFEMLNDNFVYIDVDAPRVTVDYSTIIDPGDPSQSILTILVTTDEPSTCTATFDGFDPVDLGEYPFAPYTFPGKQDDTYRLDVNCMDGAGNINETTRWILLDAVHDIEIIYPPIGQAISETNPLLRLNTSDDDTCQLTACQYGDGSLCPFPTTPFTHTAFILDQEQTHTLQLSGLSPDRVFQYTVRCVNPSQTDTATFVFSVDNSPPETTISLDGSGETLITGETFTYTSSAPVDVTLTAVDALIDDMEMNFGLNKISYCFRPSWNDCQPGDIVNVSNNHPLPDLGSTFLCVRSYDLGGNTETGFCGRIIVDGNRPVITVNVPSPSVPLVTDQTTFTVGGNASDINLDTVWAVLKDSFSIEHKVILPHVGSSFSGPVSPLTWNPAQPYLGDNTFVVWANDTIGNSGNTTRYHVYLDWGAPSTKVGAWNVTHNLSNSTNGSQIYAQHGTPVFLKARLNDTNYTAIDNSQSNSIFATIYNASLHLLNSVDLRCNGNLQGPSLCNWNYTYYPPSLGTYIVEFNYEDRFHNQGVSTVSFIVSDTIGPSFAISIGQPYPHDGAAHRGVVYNVTIRGSEPVSDTLPNLTFTCSGRVVMVPITGKNDSRTYQGLLSVEECINYSGPANFSIQGWDASGNLGTTISDGRTFAIDTRAPPYPTIIYPLQGDNLNYSTVTVEGVSEPDHFVNISVVLIENGTVYHNVEVPSGGVILPEAVTSVNQTAPRGTNVLYLNGDFGTLLSGGHDHYLASNDPEHQVPHYSITEYQYLILADKTRVVLSEPLRKNLVTRNVSIYNDSRATGQFTTTFNALQGWSGAIASSRDAYGNRGPLSPPRLFLVDTVPPAFNDWYPVNNTRTGDIITNISVKIRDMTSGVDTNSVNLSFTGEYFDYYDLDTIGPDEDGWTEYYLDGLYIEDGTYTPSLFLKDHAGNPATTTWTFEVDPYYPGTPDLFIRNGYQFGDRWYIKGADFIGNLSYPDEEVAITRDELWPQGIIPLITRTSINTFDVGFSGVDENPTLGYFEHHFNIWAQKRLINGSMGPEGLHIKYITVDLTTPILETRFPYSINTNWMDINGTAIDYFIDNTDQSHEDANNILVEWYDSQYPAGEQYHRINASMGIKQGDGLTLDWTATIILEDSIAERTIPFNVTVCDMAGNCLKESYSVNIDHRAPNITSVTVPSPVNYTPVFLIATTDELAFCRWDYGMRSGYNSLNASHQFLGGEGTTEHSTYIDLREGLLWYSVSCRDVPGNVMYDSAFVQIDLDTIGPEFSDLQPEDGAVLYAVTNISAVIEDRNGISSVLFKLDGVQYPAAFNDSVLSYSPEDPGVGPHTVDITAWDGLGNSDQASWEFTIDRSTPEDPLFTIDGLQEESTRNRRPVLGANFSQSVELQDYYLQGEGTGLAMVPLPSGDAFTFVPTQDLGDGIHFLVLTASLAGGTGGIGEYRFRFTIDTTGPGGYEAYCGNDIIDAGESCDGADFGPIEGCTDLGFSGGSLSCHAPGTDHQCHFNTEQCVGPDGICGDNIINPGEECDGADFGPITGCQDLDAFEGGTLACFPPGNEEGCSFDTAQCIQPEQPVLWSTTHPDQNAWYANKNPVMAWRFSDISGISGYSYLLDQVGDTVPDNDTISDNEGLFTHDTTKIMANSPEGTSFFHIRALDNAGNWGPALHYRLNIDTIGPVVYITGPSATAATIVQINVSTDGTAINATLSVNREIQTTILVTSQNFTMNAQLGENQANHVIVSAGDRINNIGVSNELLIIHDNHPPELLYTDPVNNTRHQQVSKVIALVSEVGSGIDDALIDLYYSNGTAIPGQIATAHLPGGEMMINFTPSHPLLPPGVQEYRAQVTVIDFASNPMAATIFFSIDRDAPIITITKPEEIIAYVRSPSQLFEGTIVSDDGLSSILINNVEIMDTQYWDGAGFSYPVSVPQEAVPFPVIIRATDTSMHWASDQRTYVYDHTPPSITLEVVTPTGQDYQVVTGSFQDNVRITIAGVKVRVENGGGIVEVPAWQEGDTLYAANISLVEGMNTVTAIATDAAGNNATATKTILKKTSLERPVLFALPAFVRGPFNISGRSEIGSTVHLWINAEERLSTIVPDHYPPLVIDLTYTFSREDAIFNTTPVVFRNTLGLPVDMWGDFIPGVVQIPPSGQWNTTVLGEGAMQYHFSFGQQTNHGTLRVQEMSTLFNFPNVDLTHYGITNGMLNAIFARAVDQVGNEGDSETRYVTLDNLPPAITNLNPGDGDVIGENTNLVVSANVRDNVSGVNWNSIRLKVDNLLRQHTVNGEVVSYTFNTIDNGTHIVNLTAGDIIGNSISRIWSFTIDTNVPARPQARLGSQIVYDQQEYLRIPQTALNITFSEQVTDITTTIDGRELALQESHNNRTFIYDTGALTESSHLVGITARRPALGSTYGQWTEDFIVDLTPPLINLFGFNITNSTRPSINVSASEFVRFVNISGDAALAQVQVNASHFVVRPNLTWGDGPKVVGIKAADIVGWPSQMREHSFRLDTLAPYATIEVS